MNSLRHVTYHERLPWIPHSDLLEKPLADRMRYVRGNLATAKGGPELTQPEFAAALGDVKSGHHTVVRWEKHGQQPRAETREALARVTPYPAEAFLKEPGAGGVSLASIDARLRELGEDVAVATSLMKEALQLLREAPQRGRVAPGSRKRATG